MRHFGKILMLTMAVFTLSIVSVNAQNYAATSQKSAKTIEQQVYSKIIGLPYYGVFDFISFKVSGDTVTLTGKVHSLGTRKDAASVVKRIPGVTNVINNIEDLPPSPSDDRIRQRALRTFANNGLYRYFWEPNPEVRIIVDRGRISLEGYVANRGDYNSLNIYANGIPGVFGVTNNLNIGKDSLR